MPVCTYLTDQEFKEFTKVEDQELNELLQEVRQIFPNIFLEERKLLIKPWFKKPYYEIYYNVYNETFRPEVQHINLQNNSKIIVMAYFYGLLTNPKS